MHELCVNTPVFYKTVLCIALETNLPWTLRGDVGKKGEGFREYELSTVNEQLGS